MENPIIGKNWSEERLKSLAIRAAPDELEPIHYSRKLVKSACPEETGSDDGNMNSDREGRFVSLHETATGGFPGVPSRTRTGSSAGPTIIDRYLPPTWQQYYSEPTLSCVYPDCSSSNLEQAAWIQHMHTHIIAANSTAKTYGCSCDPEPSWLHLLQHEADFIVQRGRVSPRLLRELDIGTSRRDAAKHRGNNMRDYIARTPREASDVFNQQSIMQFGKWEYVQGPSRWIDPDHEVFQRFHKPDSVQGIPRSPSSPEKGFAVVPPAEKQPIIDAPLSSKLINLNELNDDDKSDRRDTDSDGGSGCNDLAFDGGESPNCNQSGGESTGTVCSNTSTPTARLSPSEHSGDAESYSRDYEFESGDSPGCDWSGEDGVIVHSGNTENGLGGERKRRRPNKTTRTRRPNAQCNERESLSDGEDEDKDGEGGADRPQNSKPGNQGSDFYGCPYYKREPEKYPKCASCRFSSHRVRDVKFHVLRTHLKPEQCPRGCGYRDGTVALIWKHLKETNCEKATLVELPDDIVKDGKTLNATLVKPTSWDHICMTIFKCPKSRVPDADFVEYQRNGDNDEDQDSGHLPDPGSKEHPAHDHTKGIQQAALETQSDMQQSTVKKLEGQVQQLSEQLQQIHMLLKTNVQPQQPETSTNSIYTQAISSQQGSGRGSNSPNDTSSHISIVGSCPKPTSSVSSIDGTLSGPSYGNGQHEHQSLEPMDSEYYNPVFPIVFPERDLHGSYPSTSIYDGPIQVSFTTEFAAPHPTNNGFPPGLVPRHSCHCQGSDSWLQEVPQNTVFPTDTQPQTVESQALPVNLPMALPRHVWEDFY